ncbi:MAG: tRNA pseudouridine(38-40) synthase TruA [Campylobacter sp.]|nr:tRNA pseudouridine(38-40) synthase TruA [Campylobacter sp.]
MRIKITYAYNGAKFCGSQSQPNLKAVEDKLNLALNRVGIFNKVQTSSRTDKGVHALGQVSAVDCGDFWNLDKLKTMLNRHLVPYIYVRQICVVGDDFGARFDAKARSYSYILNHAKFSPFLSEIYYFYPQIDMAYLNACLKIFIGKHDFKAYMKTGSGVKTSIRDMQKSYAYRYKNFTIINFKANGFLRSQIRLIVANCLKACKNKSFDELRVAFENGEAITKIPAPPDGLYLRKVFY